MSNGREGNMQVTINLTGQELEFLLKLQKLINSDREVSSTPVTLEDVIHECIKTAISIGADMQRGQA